MRFLRRPYSGARVETDEVMRIIVSSTTDLLQLTLLDLKLSKLKPQRVTNESQVVMVCPFEEEQNVSATKKS